MLAKRVAYAAGWFVLVLALAIPLAIEPSLRALDFSAFYCAGSAVLAHADPYRAMPLGACEHHVSTSPMFATGVILPAPLPPYTLAVTSLLARLPFPVAQHVYDIVSVTALALSILLLRRLTALPILAIAFALAPLAWIILALGQTVLFILAVLVGAAYLLHVRQERWAAIVASFAMLEPHVGLPVCATLFVWRAQTRLSLLGMGGALALLSFVTVSPAVVTEYVRLVLPAHAHSEAGNAGQASLTALLVFFGVPAATAIALGSLQYLATTALGIVVAARVARRCGEPAAFALVPALFGVLGGTFIHNYDFVLAIPAALLLAARTQRTAVVTASLIALMPVWKIVGGLPEPVLAIVAAVALLIILERSAIPALAVAAVLAGIVVLSAFVPAKPALHIPDVAKNAFAQESWAIYERANPITLADVVLKIPAWSALLVLTLATMSVQRVSAST